MSKHQVVTNPAKRTHVRLLILTLISFATMLNYLDRAIMGVAAPAITEEFAVSPALMGLLFSAFSWTYVISQVPGGIALDKFGTRLTYGASLAFWSLFTLLHGVAANIAMLFGFRLALGAAEAPCFPCNSRVLSTWFPQHERARANSCYAVGQYVGLAFFSPLLFWIVANVGWRFLFILFGAVGVLYAIGWYLMYREPQHSTKVNQAELDYIAKGGGLAYSGKAVKFSWKTVAALMSKRQILGASIGQFCGNSTLVFFLTWFPTYLVTERGMDWLHSGVLAVLPYIAASVGVALGGIISDKIIEKTGSANMGRKLPIVAGLLLASSIIAANYLESNPAIILVMSVAFFGQGMVNLGWTLVSDVAPKSVIGLAGGIFNFCANIAGILTPIVIGFIVASTGSFYGALLYIGVLALIGAASYIFIVGEVQRTNIQLQESEQ